MRRSRSAAADHAAVPDRAEAAGALGEETEAVTAVEVVAVEVVAVEVVGHEAAPDHGAALGAAVEEAAAEVAVVGGSARWAAAGTAVEASLPAAVAAWPFVVGALTVAEASLPAAVAAWPFVVGAVPAAEASLPAAVAALTVAEAFLPAAVAALPFVVGALTVAEGSLPAAVAALTVAEASLPAAVAAQLHWAAACRAALRRWAAACQAAQLHWAAASLLLLACSAAARAAMDEMATATAAYHPYPNHILDLHTAAVRRHQHTDRIGGWAYPSLDRSTPPPPYLLRTCARSNRQIGQRWGMRQGRFRPGGLRWVRRGLCGRTW